MARPKKDNADYFSHDANMRDDPKIKALRRKFSLQGYAVWCFMLEVLTSSDFFEYEWNDLNIELLSGDFDIDPNQLKDIIDYCVFLKLFHIKDGIILCFQHQKRFNSLLSKRKRDNNRVIASENPQSKVKYSKVNKSKEEYSIVDENTQEIPNSKFSIFFKEDWLNKMIEWAKQNHNLSITFEQIKSEAEKFVNTRSVGTDTHREQWEYIGYFQNIIKNLKGIEPAIKKTGVRMIEARTFHPTLKDGGHFLDYVPVREVDYPAYKQDMEAKGYSIDNNRSYVAK